MTEAAQEQHLDWKALWRWSVPLGIILGLLFAVDFYFGLVLANSWVWVVEVLAYFLLIALLFFLVGLRRGRHTGERDDGVRVMLLASGLQVPATLMLIGMFSWAFHFWYMDHFGVLFALFGFDLEGGGLGVAWWLVQALVFQIPLGVVAARIGSAVGRHSSGKPSEPDEAAEP